MPRKVFVRLAGYFRAGGGRSACPIVSPAVAKCESFILERVTAENAYGDVSSRIVVTLRRSRRVSGGIMKPTLSLHTDCWTW